MKVSELISRLESLQSQLGDVKVEIYSEEYCVDTHKIEDVTDGWYDGWRSHQDVIGICVTA